MQQFLQSKKFLIPLVIIIIAIFAGGGWYVLSSKKVPVQQAPLIQTGTVPTLSPEDIGLTLTSVSKKGGTAIDMEVDKVSDISSIDYEVDYTVAGNIPRGVIGTIAVKSGDSSEKQEVFLGTCSDVCHPDKVTSAVQFTLKVTKSSGQVYQVNKSITF